MSTFQRGRYNVHGVCRLPVLCKNVDVKRLSKINNICKVIFILIGISIMNERSYGYNVLGVVRLPEGF